MVRQKPINSKDALAKRTAQSAVLSRLMLTMSRAMRVAYPRQRPSAARLDRWMISCAMRVNDYDGHPPMTLSGLAKILVIPRSSVRRAMTTLLAMGFARQEGEGFVCDEKFLIDRLDAAYFHETREAVIAAARLLDE